MRFDRQGRTRIEWLRDRITLGRRVGFVISMTGLAAIGCGTAYVYLVADDTYSSRVPSEEQLSLDIDGSLPGGVAQLREQGVDLVEVDIDGDKITFRLDGVETATNSIVERVDITDSEGSGPFKAKKQILVLADTLVLGELVIENPVIWPGSFDGSPVITIKPRDPDERGPVVSCRSDEPCLLLSYGVDPKGSYADANNPELNENPIDTIVISSSSIDFTLDTGIHVTIPSTDSSFTTACGLSETHIWSLPTDLGLPIDDPVLVHTLCPSTPGGGVQLIIMDRSAVPTLAPLTEAQEGNWCSPSANCLWFVPT